MRCGLERVPVIVLNVLGADDWQVWRELRIRALEEAPYAFESKLRDWQGDGDREARWRDRLANVPLNLVAQLDGRPSGMVSATAPDEDRCVDLISMWVAPFARGRGVGDALVAGVIDWSREHGMRRIALDVTAGNDRAIALYSRHGFVLAAEPPACAGCEYRMSLTL